MELSKNPSDYNTFILTSGYVEGNSIGSLVVSHLLIFDEEETWQRAWEVSFLHLSSVFRTAVKLHNGIEVEGLDWARNINGCCARSIDDKDTAYCPKCGSDFSKYRVTEIDSEQMYIMNRDFFNMAVNSNIDSFGSGSWELFDSSGWQLNGAIRPGIISSIGENAEYLISAGPEEYKKSHDWNEKKGFLRNVHFMRASELE